MLKFIVVLMLLLVALTAFGQDGFGDIFDSDEMAAETQKSLNISGEAGFEYKSYFDNSWDSERIISPFVNLDLQFGSDSVEGKLLFNIDAGDMDSNITMDNLIDELSLRTFFSFGYLDLGLFKTEWGKGDGIHVIDPLNPLDQSNGISNDINEIKRSEILAKINFYIGDNGLLELVYKPNFHPMETASSGRWIVKDLPLPLNTDTIPDTESPAYSQAAARLTTTLGIFDLGGMYYYGFISEPGYYTSYTDIGDLSSYKMNLVFTKAQLFGLEAGWALGPFTFRTEGGYWLTEDSEGTTAYLYNDRVVWLAGFDIMIPGTGIFLSVQEFGSYVFDFETINPSDVDFGMSYGDTEFTNTLKSRRSYN